ncbi:peptidase [Achromatium sp. WMS3]|nr:peptidase [Achromatium sp. WMS3]
MESLLFTTTSFIIALAILIVVHEFGHFWVARTLGVKVLRFSVGFGPIVWKYTGSKDKTEYALSAIPLGGYVKMLDEQESPVPEAELPRSFNRQKLWIRSAIVAAGPIFNLLFAILAYWIVLVSGDFGIRPIIGKITPQSNAEQAGFQTGDTILAVGTQATPSWETALLALITARDQGKDVPVKVLTNQKTEHIRWIIAANIAQLSSGTRVLEEFGITPARPKIPPIIAKVIPGEPAAQIGLRPKDLLISADNVPIEDWISWVNYVRKRPEQNIILKVQRQNKILEFRLRPKAHKVKDQIIGRIGASVVIPKDLNEKYQVLVQLDPITALKKAIDKTVQLSQMMLTVIGRMVIGQAELDNIGGPISIAEFAGKAASHGILQFFKFLAAISISLGVLNLLPIPILDGGHLLFFLLEGIKGSPVSEWMQLQGQRIGIAILLLLMSLAFYTDINRLLE